MAWEITWPKEDYRKLSDTYFNEAAALPTPLIITDAWNIDRFLCQVPDEKSRKSSMCGLVRPPCAATECLEGNLRVADSLPPSSID